MAKGKYQEWLTPEGLIKLEGWARDGATDEELAKRIGVRSSTFYDWKKVHPEISEAIKKGKEVVDIMVENALLKRALGYNYTEETLEMAYAFDDEGNPIYNMATGERVKTLQTVKSVVKEVSPDVGAQAFWLKNRRPDKWRDKQQVEVSGTINNPLQGLTTEELRQLIKNGG